VTTRPRRRQREAEHSVLDAAPLARALQAALLPRRPQAGRVAAGDQADEGCWATRPLPI
jgi:hypothetical protein